MAILLLIGAALFMALVFGPQLWVSATMRRHGAERADFPGTGGELARHLLDEAGLQHVKVERIAAGDHYAPDEKAVRLSAANFDGRSVTAVAVAAHEVGHALQHAEGYGPLMLRQKLAGLAININRLGAVLLMATPVVFALTRSPVVLLGQTAAAFVIMFATVVIHAVTLPTEFNASFRRALPVLERYIPADDMPAARSVLKAAALTYVAAALVTLLDITRWLRILRF
ncbi:MAG: zinc metallopeptidase [Aestuariivirga sp.]|nr:zinc metallopeptidase [Aestuariivirga sp.]